MAAHGRTSAAALAAAVLVTACSTVTDPGGSGGLATLGPATSAPRPVDASDAAAEPAAGPDVAAPTTPSTTDPPPTTTGLSPPGPVPCAATATLPGEALGFSELRADLTGDDAPDLLIAYGIPTTEGSMRHRLRLEPSGGPPSDLELDDAFGPTVRMLGAVQIDADPTDRAGRALEVLVGLGATSDGIGVGLVGTDDTGCLFRFGDGLGGAARFTVGATDRVHQGLRCESSVAGGQVLVQLVATSTDGQTFATSDVRLQRVTTNIVPASVIDATASLDGPSLFAYRLVDCPGITAP